MLLLRAILAVAILAEGTFYLREPNPPLSAWYLGLSALAAGGFLLIGLLTPVVGALLTVGMIGVALSLFPATTPNLFDTLPATVFALTMLLTIIGTGPGRYSVDARMFGRREIIIPYCDFPLDR